MSKRKRKTCSECGGSLEGYSCVVKGDRVLCYSCMKKARQSKRSSRSLSESKRVKTDVAVIKLIRKLYDQYGKWLREGPSQVIVQTRNGWCYTNGHVLLTDFKKRPKDDATFVHVESLLPMETTYPSIKKVIPSIKDLYHVKIPESFYRCLTAWKPGVRKELCVHFREGEIEVKEQYDDDMVLSYREVDNVGMPEVWFCGAYIDILKPKDFWVSNGKLPVRIGESYNPIVDSFKIKVVMPTESH